MALVTRDPSAIIERLAARKRDFLRFVRARTGSDAEAEDLLHSAFVRAAERSGTLRDGERVEAWFYRLLRNAIIDVRREDRRASAAPQDPAPRAVEAVHCCACPCVHELVPTLKPEWARIVRRVDLEGASVPVAAREEGITPNAAAVRLHRARAALRDKLRIACGACAREGGGCLECDCHRRRP